MGQLTIYRDEYTGSTAISNVFIDTYMKDANDAQIKVYLYLIRLLNANLSATVCEIADKFNHTEKEVVRALKYWEKVGLLTLDFDSDKMLTGIHIKKIEASAPAVSAPVVTVVTKEPEEVIVKQTETEDMYAKPAYSMDELRSFQKKDNISQLIFAAQTYIGRPLSAADMKSIIYYSDVLHFSDDLIDYLIGYCVERGNHNFRYIDAVALNWAQSGVTTPKQAAKFASKYDKSVYTIMKELGKNGAPTSKEMEYINRWVKEYGFSSDIISEACGRTVMATDSHRFEYAESILSNWKKENVHRKSDIQRIDDLYKERDKRSKERPKTASSTNYANKFHQLNQRDYDFEELEAKLLSK